MAASNAVSYQYVVTSLTDASNGNVSVLLTPEVKFVDNGDGTTVATQAQQSSLSFTMSESDAKAFWPGQSVTLTLK